MLKLSDAFQIIRRELTNVAETVYTDQCYDQCFIDHRAKAIAERLFDQWLESHMAVNDLGEGI